MIFKKSNNKFSASNTEQIIYMYMYIYINYISLKTTLKFYLNGFASDKKYFSQYFCVLVKRCIIWYLAGLQNKRLKFKEEEKVR